MTVVCETLIAEGKECGITAQGRCDLCSRAFCSSHRALPTSNFDPISRCRTCVMEEAAAKAEHDNRCGRRYIERHALQELQGAGVPTADIYCLSLTWKKNLFGRYREVRSLELWSRGWILGTHEWRVDDPLPDARASQSQSTVRALTVLRDNRRPNDTQFVMEFGHMRPPFEQLVRVSKDDESGNYVVSCVRGHLQGDFESLSRAVHRLLGR